MEFIRNISMSGALKGSLAWQWEKDGWEKGLKEGEIKERKIHHAKVLKMAEKMIVDGLPNEMIATYTELPISEIQKIRKRIQF